MVAAKERAPEQQQQQQQRPDDPLQFFPLTRDNIRENLPRIIQQMFTYDLQSLKTYGRMMHRLYAPQATFHYPLALLHGREAVCQFWHSFLIGRALQRNDVHSLRVDMIWDAERLQAFVQLEAWQHIVPLAWVDKLIGMPSWKVWSTQVIQFEEHPTDGLVVVVQEELQDQFTLLGSLHVGLSSVRTDPGTPLNWIRDAVRSAVGAVIAVGTPVMVQLLEAVGWIKQQ